MTITAAERDGAAPAGQSEPATVPTQRGRAATRRGRTAAASGGCRFRLEGELYPPVKRFLEAQGYTAKGEVRGCDVLAVRSPDEPPVVVELKLAFTLSLVLQAVDRLAVTDMVYLALPARVGAEAADGSSAGARRRPAFSPAHPGVRRLCRRLGLGLLAVHPDRTAAPAADAGAWVEVVLDPTPCRVPRRNKDRAARLLREHARRQGDPTPGGGTGGRPVVTAYRQEALRCAELLRRSGGGPLAVADVRHRAAAPNAARILYRNVYGWFEPAGRGLYRLTAQGAEGLHVFAGRFEPVDGGAQAGPSSAAFDSAG